MEEGPQPRTQATGEQTPGPQRTSPGRTVAPAPPGGRRMACVDWGSERVLACGRGQGSPRVCEGRYRGRGATRGHPPEPSDGAGSPFFLEGGNLAGERPPCAHLALPDPTRWELGTPWSPEGSQALRGPGPRGSWLGHLSHLAGLALELVLSIDTLALAGSQGWGAQWKKQVLGSPRVTWKTDRRPRARVKGQSNAS